MLRHANHAEVAATRITRPESCRNEALSLPVSNQRCHNQADYGPLRLDRSARRSEVSSNIGDYANPCVFVGSEFAPVISWQLGAASNYRTRERPVDPYTECCCH